MSCGTLVLTDCLTFSLTGLLPALAALSRALRLKSYMSYVSPQPRGACSSVCPLSRSLAATKEIIIYFLFLRVLRCFSSPGALRQPMDSVGGVGVFPQQVSPFGNLRINACLQLPAAYRSLPRPSSAYGALASTLRSC